MDSLTSIDAIVAALQSAGWCHCPAFLAPELVDGLRTDLLAQRDRFAAASVGRANARQQLLEQRNDSTLWLSGAGAAQREFLAQLDNLRQQLNRQLFLGLADYEAHYAHYAAGQFYRRHVDAFRQGDERQREAGAAPQRIVSSVFYLNDNWQVGDGGELVLWRDQGRKQERGREQGQGPLQIAPLSGSAVFFLSAEFPHEVLPAARDRYSIAGWFRNRPAGFAIPVSFASGAAV